MILAAGLTPAWQQILTFERLIPGEVNRARSTLWCGSGKVLNVGAALNHLGATSLTLSPIGGATGQQIRDDFQQRGIAARWIPTTAATRVCNTLLDQSTGVTTELVENSAPLTEAELSQYVSAFAEEARKATCIVLSGSLPQRTPHDFYRRLMGQSDVTTIMDVRGRELLECLPLNPFLVKPNREELAATVGRPLPTEATVVEAMEQVRKLGATWVIVSGGPAPLLVLGPDGLQRITPPKVRVVNPIGCGDSLTAAIAARIQAGCDPLEAIRFGVEYSAKKAGSLYPVLTNSECGGPS